MCFAFAAVGQDIPIGEIVSAQNAPEQKSKTGPIQNVVLIVADGVRTEEFFIGANPYAKRRGPAQTKEKLFPFLWGELGSRAGGETYAFGNRFRQRPGKSGDVCRIDNNYGISLPAYADLLGGVRQPAVRSNIFTGRLPHPTIPDRLLEHGFGEDDVAIFASWKHIASIVSAMPPAGFHVDTGRGRGEDRPRWKDARYDRDLQKTILNYLREREHENRSPVRFLFAAFNDSDEWAHIGNYGRYLSAIRRQDGYIRELYNYLESQPDYNQKTLYIITTDHGRGRGRHWKSHGRVPGSQYVWAMIHAPGQPERLAAFAQLLQTQCSHTALGTLVYKAATGEISESDASKIARLVDE